MRKFRLGTAVALAAVSIIAWQAHSDAADVEKSKSTASAKPSALPMLTVYKNESCGCCKLWVEHMKAAGFPVEVHDVDNLQSIKESMGVPSGKGSCHTARLGRRYFVEGHVPAEDVKRFLAEARNARGLTVPAMPAGSPGMEIPSGQVQPYDVLLVDKDGKTSVYAHHDK